MVLDSRDTADRIEVISIGAHNKTHWKSNTCKCMPNTIAESKDELTVHASWVTLSRGVRRKFSIFFGGILTLKGFGETDGGAGCMAQSGGCFCRVIWDMVNRVNRYECMCFKLSEHKLTGWETTDILLRINPLSTLCLDILCKMRLWLTGGLMAALTWDKDWTYSWFCNTYQDCQPLQMGIWVWWHGRITVDGGRKK